MSDNRILKRQNRKLRQENEQLLAYIRGLETGIRAGKRVTIQQGGAQV